MSTELSPPPPWWTAGAAAGVRGSQGRRPQDVDLFGLFGRCGWWCRCCTSSTPATRVTSHIRRSSWPAPGDSRLLDVARRKIVHVGSFPRRPHRGW